MAIYYIAVTLSAILAVVLTKRAYVDGVKQQNITLADVCIAMLPLFLVALFRWNVGVDVVYGSGYYAQAYKAIETGRGNIFGYEAGFYMLMKLCESLHLNLYLFYCVVTCLFFGLFAVFLYRNSENLTLSILLFFAADLYLFSFSALRQALALALFLYPAAQIFQGKKIWKDWKAILSTIFAVSVHTSILYLLLVLLAATIRCRKQVLLIFVILGCACGPFIRRGIAWLMSFTVYFEKYIGTKEFLTEFTPTYFVLALVAFIPAYLWYDKLVEKNKYNYILIQIAAIIVVLMLNSQVLVMPYRIFPLFVPVYFILFPKIVSCSSVNAGKRLVISGMLLFPFFLMFLNQYYRHGGYEFYRYQHIFQNLEQVLK